MVKNSTDAVKDSRVLKYVNVVSSLQYRKFDFEEFCAAAVSVHQLEGIASWEQQARNAYKFFEKDGNMPIMIEELASELGLSPSVPVHIDWEAQLLGVCKTSTWGVLPRISKGLKHHRPQPVLFT